MLHLEIVGSNPRPSVPGRIGYTERSTSITPTPRSRPHTLLPVTPRRGIRPIDDATTAFVRSAEASNAQIVPVDYLRTVSEALTSYQSTPSGSGRSSPTVTETQSTTSSAQVGWTGNTTERSSTDSTYSWNEFDKQAAKTVQSFFEEIDSVLFEHNLDGPQYIRKECQEWQSQFPHLRILGRQLMLPQDTGYHVIHTDSSRPSTGSMGITDITDHDISTTPDLQGLSLTGRSIEAKSVPLEARSVLSSSQREESSLTSEYHHLEEEILEQEGYYEEIIAIDYKDIYDESLEQKKQITPRRHRVGYPPITPNACVKDSVLSSVFDSLWQEIIAWNRNLNKKYSILVLEENKPLVIPMQPLSPPNRHEHLLLSREPSFSTAMSRQRSYTAAAAPNLDDVLLISSKKISVRETSNLQDYSETPVPSTQRPTSSFQQSATRRPLSTKFVRPPAQKPARLAPIQSDASKAYTEERVGPNGALQVIKIAHARNGALPPLNAEVEPSKGQKRGNSRASSAVVKDSLSSHRERYGMIADARPSTTHAMRSDTPQGNFNSRRASTPFGPGLTAIPSRSAIGGGGMVLGIMGSGLQPSSDLVGHPLQPEISEDQENMEDVPYNKWTPSPPSHHNPYYRGRLKHYPLGVRP